MPCLNCEKPDHKEMEGKLYDPSWPRACWLYANDPRYRALGNGEPIPEQTTILPGTPTMMIEQDFGGTVTIYTIYSPNVQPGRPGPGSQLQTLFAELGLKGWAGCPCAARARQMDLWGPEGCRLHRGEIIEWMKEAREHLGWMEFLRAAKLLAFKVSWTDPLGSLIDEAIRRAAM